MALSYGVNSWEYRRMKLGRLPYAQSCLLEAIWNDSMDLIVELSIGLSQPCHPLHDGQNEFEFLLPWVEIGVVLLLYTKFWTRWWINYEMNVVRFNECGKSTSLNRLLLIFLMAFAFQMIVELTRSLNDSNAKFKLECASFSGKVGLIFRTADMVLLGFCRVAIDFASWAKLSVLITQWLVLSFRIKS